MVWLDGVNQYKKAVKGEGYKDVELPMAISNVAHFDAKSDGPSRVKVLTNKNGKKERVYVKSGAKIA